MNKDFKTDDCVDFSNGVELPYGVTIFKPNATVPGKILAASPCEYAKVAKTPKKARQTLKEAALRSFANAILNFRVNTTDNGFMAIGRFAVFAIPIPKGELSPVTSKFDFVPNLEREERVCLSFEELHEGIQKDLVNIPEGLFATLDEAMEGSIVKHFKKNAVQRTHDEPEERPVLI